MKTYYEMKYNYKNLFKDAHEMTRKTVLKYKNISYKTQFVICIRFIANQLLELRNEICRQSQYVKEVNSLYRELRALEKGRNSKNKNAKILDTKNKQCAVFELVKEEHQEKDKRYLEFINNLIGA